MASNIMSKVITNLADKKYRQSSGKFLVEGENNVAELLESDFAIDIVYATKEFKKKYSDLLSTPNLRVQGVDAGELKKLGTLAVNDDAIAIAFQKKQKESEAK